MKLTTLALTLAFLTLGCGRSDAPQRQEDGLTNDVEKYLDKVDQDQEGARRDSSGVQH
jgi:hypothetical protein